MTAFTNWIAATLVASAVLMLVVLLVRAPVRRWIGPQLGFALWAFPTLRLVIPPLSFDVLGALPLVGRAAAGMPVLFVGPYSTSDPSRAAEPFNLGNLLLAIWLAGAVGVFATYAARHFVVCRRLRATSTDFARHGTVRVVAADVEGPLAFGVFHRFVAVPRTFLQGYSAAERELALAHEYAHHARGDLIANWLSLIVLALHWWNPIAWVALRAFREDQEFAADASVLAAAEPTALQLYAQVLAKAAGIGALPACNLNLRANLKGRLMMLSQKQRSNRQVMLGSMVLALLGGTALAATATRSGRSAETVGRQAVTIGVKPDGSGGHALVIGDRTVAPDAPLPGGLALPADFTAAGGCSLKPTADAVAMVIKGMDGTETYTVMCARSVPAPVRVTLAEGLASLKTMRASVATQPASPAFPEAERTHALGAIDRSIGEVQATLSALN